MPVGSCTNNTTLLNVLMKFGGDDDGELFSFLVEVMGSKVDAYDVYGHQVILQLCLVDWMLARDYYNLVLM